MLAFEEKALVEEVACGSGAASTETIADLRRQVLELERTVEVQAVDRGLAEGTNPQLWAAKT